jgi:5-methylthioadenosine/S-adenosylhomocysteine deaminase
MAVPPAREADYRIFKADYVLTGGALRGGLGVEVSVRTGRIGRIGPVEALAGPRAIEVVHLRGRVLLPGGVNSHSHAFQIFLRGRTDDSESFRRWVDRGLYPLVLALDEESLESAMLLAFAEMVRHGITTVGEFFYIHNARETFERLGNRYADLAIATARRVGLRIALLRAIYDRGAKLGQQRFLETPGEAERNVRALAEAHKTDPFVSVLPAPHSLHGASPEAIAAGKRIAEDLGTKFHIHLAEQRSDLELSRREYGTSPLRALEKLGLLSPRLVAVHGCWLDVEEMEALGAAGGGLVCNPSANLMLGDGITDMESAVRSGVTVSLGCDGPGGNNKLDLFEEMRLAETLQRVRLLRMGVLSRLRPDDPCVPFTLGTRNGGLNLGLAAGEIVPGAFGDFIAVDCDDLSLAPHHGLDTRTFLNNLLHAGDIRSALTDVIVGGEFALRDRRLVRVDEEEIRERVRRWERRPFGAFQQGPGGDR